MQNEREEYYINVLKNSLMSNWAVARSTELSVILKDCKGKIDMDPSITSQEKAEHHQNLNEAYRKVVEELVGCN